MKPRVKRNMLGALALMDTCLDNWSDDMVPRVGEFFDMLDDE